MEQQLVEIREQQRASWNKFSPGWKKWDTRTMDFLRPPGEEIIRQLKPSGDDYVLDVAAGTGEPGLTIASMLDGGKVMITDLAEHMLAIAAENARARGINNVETKACDVCDLPFEDNTFDLISCRMGYMFFPDMQMAANEMYRVLKPGGKMSTAVWNVAEKNFWITATISTINENIEVPPPPAGSPGMFRCCKPGLMKEVLEKAGFKNITETEVATHFKCDSPEMYWEFMTDVAAPVVAALSKADEATVKKIREEVIGKIRARYPNEVAIEGSSLVFTAEK